jgi:hypothetical protein
MQEIRRRRILRPRTNSFRKKPRLKKSVEAFGFPHAEDAMNRLFLLRTSLTLFIPALASCLLLATDIARAAGSITDVDMTPDGKSVVIKSDAPLGRHRDFVIGGPNRLVVDFDESGLGKVPRRIPLELGNVREIRLGYQGSNARLVVDFGESSVPKYNIRNEGFAVKVILDSKGTLPLPTATKPSQTKPRAVSDPQTARSGGRPPTPSTSSSGKTSPAVASVRVVGETVSLEILDGKSSGKSMKVNVEVDMEEARVRKAYVVQHRDAPKPSEKIDKPSSSSGGASAKAGPIRGPRRAVEAGVRDEDPQKKFRWGMPEVRSVEPPKPRTQTADPVHLDQIALQPRPEGKTGRVSPPPFGSETKSPGD